MVRTQGATKNVVYIMDTASSLANAMQHNAAPLQLFWITSGNSEGRGSARGLANVKGCDVLPELAKAQSSTPGSYHRLVAASRPAANHQRG